MSMLPIEDKVYDDGRTKQSFKNSTDINKILAKAQKTGTFSHLAKYEARYGDFASFDFFDAQKTIADANSIFAELPSEVRTEFEQDPSKFFAFANDPANVGSLAKLLPKIAEPGSYFPNVRPSAENPPVAPPEPTAKTKVIPEVGVPVEDTGEET